MNVKELIGKLQKYPGNAIVKGVSLGDETLDYLNDIHVSYIKTKNLILIEQ